MNSRQHVIRRARLRPVFTALSITLLCVLGSPTGVHGQSAADSLNQPAPGRTVSSLFRDAVEQAAARGIVDPALQRLIALDKIERLTVDAALVRAERLSDPRQRIDAYREVLEQQIDADNLYYRREVLGLISRNAVKAGFDREEFLSHTLATMQLTRRICEVERDGYASAEPAERFAEELAAAEECLASVCDALAGMGAACDEPAVPAASEDSGPVVSGVRVLDANPAYYDGRELPVWSAPEFASRQGRSRRGAVADGASELALVVETNGPARILARVETEDGEIVGALGAGGFVAPGADGVVVDSTPLVQDVDEGERNGKPHVAVLQYRAPESAGTSHGGEREASVRLSVSALAAVDPGPLLQQVVSLQLAAPPVVLVHGTYSDPSTFTKAGQQGTSMKDTLERAGRRVFMVNYERTNGYRYGRPSSFAANKMVVWEDRDRNSNGTSNGIRAALVAMRDPDGSNLAATRVDVVGHSLGGLLPRVYASPGIGGAPEGWSYRRIDNFRRGDIRRLVTLCSPHHGSDLSQVLVILDRPGVQGKRSLFDRIGGSALAKAIGYLQGMLGDAAVSQIPARGGSADLPEGSELALIGATPIATHAIGCVARQWDMIHQYDGEYMKRVMDLTAAFFRFPGIARNLFERRGQTDGVAELITAIENVGARSSTGFLTGESQEFVAIRDRELIGRMVRAAIFGHTPDDGTVRLQSQLGSLKPANYTIITGVLHGYAPAYAEVQARVRELLDGAIDPFATRMPPAGKPLDYQTRQVPGQTKQQRLQAIDASNMVPAHAEAFSSVVASQTRIIIVRPVNEASTALIGADNATKGMHVKGKSADWGPHEGFIAVDQAFSKLAGKAGDGEPAQAADIAKYNCEVVETVRRQIARPTPYQVEIDGRTYAVRKLKAVSSGSLDQFDCDDKAGFAARLNGRVTGARPALFLRDAQGVYLSWPELSRSLPAPANDDNTLEFMVLADSTSGRMLTADYDLLAIGTRFPRGKLLNDAEKGNITARQTALLHDLNAAVRASGYAGGNVVHHGPENQFFKSPGVDYPVVAFEPSGRIRVIESGPEGFEDMLLKRYFFRRRQEGWHLDPNPRWNWEARGTDAHRSYDGASGWPDAQGPIVDVVSDDGDARGE